jgi:hypothetical protein
LLLDTKQPEAAIAEAQQCLDVVTPLLSRSDSDARRIAADCRLTHGDALAARGRSGEAHLQWSEALTAIEPVARSSEDPAFLQIWARALHAVGRLKEANELAARLTTRGYRHPSFLQVFDKGARST